MDINGREFEFVKVTLAKQEQLAKKFRITLRDVLSNKLFPYRDKMRLWKKTRNVAFVKDWKWKYLGIVPKELRCSNINIRRAGELQADFFGYVKAEVSAHDELLRSVNQSETSNSTEKPAV